MTPNTVMLSVIHAECHSCWVSQISLSYSFSRWVLWYLWN